MGQRFSTLVIIIRIQQVATSPLDSFACICFNEGVQSENFRLLLSTRVKIVRTFSVNCCHLRSRTQRVSWTKPGTKRANKSQKALSLVTSLDDLLNHRRPRTYKFFKHTTATLSTLYRNCALMHKFWPHSSYSGINKVAMALSIRKEKAKTLRY